MEGHPWLGPVENGRRERERETEKELAEQPGLPQSTMLWEGGRLHIAQPLQRWHLAARSFQLP
eukprot:12929021-Prorocentrum_lima.AAC.1